MITMAKANDISMSFNNKEYVRFRKYLPPDDDVTLIVLKGHLLIEENMYAMIAEKLERPLCLKQANLSYSKLKWIAEGLFYKPSEKWLWKTINIINQTRNELAHRLDTPKLQQQLESLFHVMENDCPVNGFFKHAKYKNKAELLRRTISDICFYLWAMRKDEAIGTV